MIEKRFSQIVRPSTGSMNLDTGKIDGKEAFIMAGFSIASILVMAIGGILLVWSSPKYSYDWTWYRGIGMMTGGLISLCGFRFAWSMSGLMLHSWHAYHQRLADWHDAELQTYLDQRGVETEVTFSQTEILPEVAKDVLITALLIQYRLQRDQRYQHAPWSTRGLEEKLYLDSNANAILIGELRGTKPEVMSSHLAALGLVINRKPGHAGEWAMQSFEEIFDRVGRNWGKIR